MGAQDVVDQVRRQPARVVEAQAVVGVVGERLVGDGAEVLPDLGIVVAAAEVEGETVGPVAEIDLDAADAGHPSVANLAEAVLAEER